MKIAIIGANGQLGSDLLRVFENTEHEIVPLDHTDVDVTDFRSSENIFKNIQPKIIINCAAFIC